MTKKTDICRKSFFGLWRLFRFLMKRFVVSLVIMAVFSTQCVAVADIIREAATMFPLGYTDGAYIEFAFSPGFGNSVVGYQIKDNVVRSEYRNLAWSYTQFGIGWFNADGTPVQNNGKLFGSNTVPPNGIGIPTGTDLTNPENAQKYLVRPGIAWNSLDGIHYGVNERNTNAPREIKLGIAGDLYTINTRDNEKGLLEKKGSGLAAFRDQALANQNQSADNAQFTWLCIDLTNIQGTVPYFYDFSLANMTVGGNVLDLSGLVYGQKNYFNIGGISVNEFALELAAILGYSGSNTYWQPWSIYAITAMADPDDVEEFKRLKEIAEQANVNFNDANAAIFEIRTRIEQFNFRIAEYEATVFGSYEEQFAAYMSLLEEYEELQSILNTVEALLADAAKAKMEAEARLNDYEEYGKTRQHGIDSTFMFGIIEGDLWDIADLYSWDWNTVTLASVGSPSKQNGSEVPEPATILIVGFGIAVLGLIRRKNCL